MRNKTILVTGGTGYIGSHTVVELLNAAYNVVIVDNLSNSSSKVLDRIKQLSINSNLVFYKLDLADKFALEEVFLRHKIDAVIHFAALKAVGESVTKPLAYYKNNLGNSLVLFEVMQKFNVQQIVFSSSATVYGEPPVVPIQEHFPTNPTSPYGFGKLMLEQILTDLQKANNHLAVAILRYFNPVGAHKSGLIGEDPTGIPNNLMPYITQVAIGKLEYLNVFGNDYATPDGTGVRDYIHVVDLAIGHIKALEYLFNNPQSIIKANLGTGVGYSVLQVIEEFSKASGRVINYKFAPRRSGDIAECYADPALAYAKFNWQARFNLLDMCRDSWTWQAKNPHGYN